MSEFQGHFQVPTAANELKVSHIHRKQLASVLKNKMHSALYNIDFVKAASQRYQKQLMKLNCGDNSDSAIKHVYKTIVSYLPQASPVKYPVNGSHCEQSFQQNALQAVRGRWQRFRRKSPVYSTWVFGERMLAGPSASPHRWSLCLLPGPLNVTPRPPVFAPVSRSELPSEAGGRQYTAILSGLWCAD